MKHTFSFPLTNDEEIRQALKSNIARTNHKKIIEEMGIDHGTRRADIVVIGCKSFDGYEIKSDQDDLTRLRGQAESYNRIFNKVTLVVGKKHIVDALDIIPDWWGIQLAKKEQNNNLQIYNIRKPKKNKEQDGTAIARLLWRQEALNILEEYKEDKGIRSKPREYLYERINKV